nr:MAG TPA: protein of unknown function (DUF4417) [Caudoviricetes sp.]
MGPRPHRQQTKMDRTRASQLQQERRTTQSNRKRRTLDATLSQATAATTVVANRQTANTTTTRHKQIKRKRTNQTSTHNKNNKTHTKTGKNTINQPTNTPRGVPRTARPRPPVRGLASFCVSNISDTESNRNYYSLEVIVMSERDRTFNAYNLPLLRDAELAGAWDVPALAPCDEVPDDLVGFNYVKSLRGGDSRRDGVHFFLDDYQFERVWRRPDLYMRMLARFWCVLTPDFSLYRDMPLAVQLHNVFRSRLIGAFWQRQGLRVIPTLQWSTPESFDFVFDGLPERSTVAVSTVGVLTDPVATALWRLGMSEALERLRPNLVLLYGLPMPDFDWRGTEWIRYENKTIERMQHGRTRV